MDEILKPLLGIILKVGGPLATVAAGPAAGAVVGKVGDLIGSALGLDGPEQVAEAARANPAQVEAAVRQVASDPAQMADIVALAAEETKRLMIVNETMRFEMVNGDRFQRYWRPACGYVFASLCAAIGVIWVYATVDAMRDNDVRVLRIVTESIPSIGMWVLLPLAAAVGIAVWQRGREKAAAGVAGAVAAVVDAVRPQTAGRAR